MAIYPAIYLFPQILKLIFQICNLVWFTRSSVFCFLVNPAVEKISKLRNRQGRGRQQWHAMQWQPTLRHSTTSLYICHWGILSLLGVCLRIFSFYSNMCISTAVVGSVEFYVSAAKWSKHHMPPNQTQPQLTMTFDSEKLVAHWQLSPPRLPSSIWVGPKMMRRSKMMTMMIRFQRQWCSGIV